MLSSSAQKNHFCMQYILLWWVEFSVLWSNEIVIGIRSLWKKWPTINKEGGAIFHPNWCLCYSSSLELRLAAAWWRTRRRRVPIMDHCHGKSPYFCRLWPPFLLSRNCSNTSHMPRTFLQGKKLVHYRSLYAWLHSAFDGTLGEKHIALYCVAIVDVVLALLSWEYKDSHECSGDSITFIWNENTQYT